MSRRRGFVLALSIIVGHSSGTGAEAAPAPQHAEAPDAAATDDEAMAFRRTFGFPADPETVQSARMDPAYSADPYGVPLSSSEIAELFRRAQIQASIGPAYLRARQEPSFAGTYFDQLVGGEPVFLFEGESSGIAEEIRQRLPDGTGFRVEGATYTESELLGVKERIDASVDSLWAEGIEIVRVAVKTSENRLRLGVLNPGERVAQRLTELFGPAVTVFGDLPKALDVCDATNNCRPIKGGISMNPVGKAAGQCTTGFSVKSTAGNRYILTAGHCIQYHGGFDVVWQHNANRFGNARHETWIPGGNGPSDVGLIIIDSDEQAAMANQMNRMRRTNGSVVQVVGTAMLGSWLEGGQACRVGHTSGHDCGTISEWRVSSPRPSKAGSQTMMVTQVATVDFDSLGGDSGGPVFFYVNHPSESGNVYALGTHVHSEEGAGADEGWFSGIIEGEDDFSGRFGYGYTVCDTSAC